MFEPSASLTSLPSASSNSLPGSTKPTDRRQESQQPASNCYSTKRGEPRSCCSCSTSPRTCAREPKHSARWTRADTPGTRVSVDMCELKLDRRVTE